MMEISPVSFPIRLDEDLAFRASSRELLLHLSAREEMILSRRLLSEAASSPAMSPVGFREADDRRRSMIRRRRY